MYPESLQRLLRELERLPGVGGRTAERLAFHILKDDRDAALRLARAIRDVKETTRACRACGMVTESELCSVCADPERDPSVVCVVEQPKDLLAIERLGRYRGVYCVLMGGVAPLDGVEASHLHLDTLEERLTKGSVREVIVATNPNLEGDTTALHLIEHLKGSGVRITRIARGVPAGSAIAHASRATLEDALEDRRQVDPPAP